MNNNNQDLEVTFNDAVTAVVRRWKSILVVMLACAVLLGGLTGLKTMKTVNSPAQREKAQQAYDQAMERYEQELATQRKLVDRLEQNLDSEHAYLEQSVLMNMDPYQVWTAKASYYIDTNYQIQPDSAMQNPDNTPAILTGYQAELTSGQVIDAMAKAADMDPQYLRELCWVNIGTLTGSVNQVLTINVYHSDETMARTILESYKQELEQVHGMLSRQVGEHSCTLLSESVALSKDADVADLQEQERKEMANLEKTLKAEKDAMKEISKPASKSVSAADAVRSGVKFAVVGAVLGLVGAAAVICIAYLMSDKVYSGMEVTRRTGVRLLGSIETREKKRCAMDAAILRMQGRPCLPAGQAYALAAADIRNYGGEGAVLLTGDLPRENLDQMARALEQELKDIKVIAAGSILRDAEAAAALKHCSGVVLAGQAGVTRYSAIRRQITKVQSLEANLMGCVILEK